MWFRILKLPSNAYLLSKIIQSLRYHIISFGLPVVLMLHWKFQCGGTKVDIIVILIWMPAI